MGKAQGANEIKFKPVIVGEPWQIAGDPDLGKYTTEKQQPVDFGIWQAADSTWQVWSCIRRVNTECPFVYFNKSSGYYYLFRTQNYGENSQTSVYQSKDLKDFGVNDDRYPVTTLPVAALPSLKGIQIAKLEFEKK